MSVTIDLNKFLTPNSKVFTGRQRGKEVREQSRISEYVNEDSVEIIIPKDIYAISASFLEELLFHVVKELGNKKDFLKRFHFQDEGEYGIEEDLEEAIDRILKGYTALHEE